jgi:hypothetical protein
MTSDDRLTWNLFSDILGALERHGYRRSDSYHVEQVIRAVSDLTCTYEGTGAAAHGNYLDHAQPQPEDSSTEAAQNAVVLSGAEALTVFAALDIATDHKRYRVEMCPDCPDQSCRTCQTDVKDAQAFDRLADRMLQAAKTAPAAHHDYAEPSDPPRPPRVAADKEAGQ